MHTELWHRFDSIWGEVRDWYVLDQGYLLWVVTDIRLLLDDWIQLLAHKLNLPVRYEAMPRKLPAAGQQQDIQQFNGQQQLFPLQKQFDVKITGLDHPTVTIDIFKLQHKAGHPENTP